MSEPSRWQAYADGTSIEHFNWWCRNSLFQSQDRFAGKPLELEPWQLEFMAEALAVHGDGASPWWRSVVLIVSRKNGKTALLAAYALYRLLHDDGAPEILLAASSDKQAGRLFDAVLAYARRNPALLERLHLRAYIGEIARADGGGKIVRMASDPNTLHGYNPSLVICDELHAWTKPSQREAWAALTTAGGARDWTQTFTITTAGSARQREDSILGGLLDRNEQDGELERHEGLTISRNGPAETLIYNYSAPTTDVLDVRAMKLANPASWITEKYLERQARNPELSEAEVLQLHGCVWAAHTDSWLPAGAWRSCEDAEKTENARKSAQNRDVEIVLAFDGSYSRDSTALVACTVEEVPVLWVEAVWERPEGQRDGWRVPRGEVSEAVDAAMTKYEVRELACDPPGWHQEIEAWGERYDVLTLMFATNQRQLMHEACSQFYSAVVEKRLAHDGDKALARHLANAIVKSSPDGRFKYISKDHPDSSRKIDLAVAAVVAHARARSYAGESSEPMIAFI